MTEAVCPGCLAAASGCESTPLPSSDHPPVRIHVISQVPRVQETVSDGFVLDKRCCLQDCLRPLCDCQDALTDITDIVMTDYSDLPLHKCSIS